MGKKIKKDEKGPPEDVFDSLLVESRQAATVVLMLSSPEEDVLSKACEAIYKFVDKCDENKKTLLDLDAVDALLRLIQHEDRIVRRNACMAVGVMAAHTDVRKMLRKREDAIPSLVKLMSPEEDTVVHEFAALGLCALAQDFSGKVYIHEQDGMEPLIQCLSSSDPDVQKNGIETISLLVQDYQSKAALRELNGLPPLLDLIKSEYPVIQHLALVSLQRATEDPENRAVIRELEGINKLIEFLGRPDYCELHVFAVIVLSNCLEDPESMEQIRENGGLSKLVAFITDTTPHEEEETKGGKAAKGKGADKGASRAGKKGKGDDASSARSPTPKGLAALRSQTRNGGGTSQLGSRLAKHPTTESRQQIVSSRQQNTSSRQSALGKTTVKANKTTKKPASRLFVIHSADLSNEEDSDPRASSSRSIMHSRNANSVLKFAIPEKPGDGKTAADPVIPTLPEVKEHTCRAIARAAKNAENRKILHEQEVEKMLILLLSFDNQKVQVASAQALGVMSENLISRESVGQWDGIEPLIKMIKNDNPDVREAASMALANLTTSNMNNCNEVVRYHGIDPLIALLSDQRELAVANAAIILTNMAPDEHYRTLAQNAGVVKALIYPMSSTNSLVISKVALCSGAFVCDADARATFREHNGVEPLVQMLHSSNDEVRRSASWAITVCATDEPTAMEVSKYGGLEVLQEIQMSSTRKNAFTDVALQKLLDCNLSAKYALMNTLSQENLTTDGFYDLGSMRPGSVFLTLEEYCKQDVNQKRPIILINAKPEKPQTPAPAVSENEITDKSSKSSIGGRNSRTGRDKAKKRDKEREKEKEEVQNKEVDVSQTEDQGPFTPPGDYNLMKYIDEVTDKIAPLPSTKDQAIALAQFVCDKMGGAIDRGQVANFSWELPISQLKFDLKSNVVPIGMIKAGIHIHRALLFKALADRIALGCTLVRGDYNRAWNVILISAEEDLRSTPKFPPKAYIVDLVHQPGKLMPADSPEGVNYQKL